VGEYIGRARLPNGPSILTKLLTFLVLAFGYTDLLAEPRDKVWQGEGRYAGKPGNHLLKI
jgi:hypothetical protein